MSFELILSQHDNVKIFYPVGYIFIKVFTVVLQPKKSKKNVEKQIWKTRIDNAF